MPASENHLLILGGTQEAVKLADVIGRCMPRLRVTTSLAGRTRKPVQVKGDMRTGGFGGAAGLADWLASENVTLVVDATHPFAAQISDHAKQACDRQSVPRLILSRQAWRAQPGDDWRLADDLDSAAMLLPEMGDRVFLSVGSQGLGAFSELDGIHFLVRMIDSPREQVPLKDYRLIQGRGPFDEISERRLLEAERVDAVVSRNSGGTATYAKIAAARQLGLPVVMVAPPKPEEGPRVDDVREALHWVEKQVTE